MNSEAERLEDLSVDNDVAQVLDICKGDTMAALRLAMVAIQFYDDEIRRLKLEASSGYGRGRVRKPVKKTG